MPLYHNKISNKELKLRLLQEEESRITISFYKYARIDDCTELRDHLYKTLNDLNVFGRIYIAEEGINAQISVPQSSLESFKTFINSIEALNNLRLNIAVDNDGKSFWVLKIKVRNKIVADGINDSTFSMEQKGKYVDAKEMNEMIKSSDTIVVDMRNHYEYEVGHFENAIEISSDTFREQLPMAAEMLQNNKNKKIIMYCTGGIRCEKASAYMVHKGFKNVYHLDGGIINYARQVKDENLENKFTGKNFVFDNRLGERITEDIISKCHQCGKSSDAHTNCVNNGCHLLFIQCAECAEKYEGCCSEECKQIIHLPVEEQQMLRTGINKGRNVFNKSKKLLRPRLNIRV